MELCTQCHSDARKVEHVSALAVVDYYRCPQCGTIWTVPKESMGPMSSPGRHENHCVTPAENLLLKLPPGSPARRWVDSGS